MAKTQDPESKHQVRRLSLGHPLPRTVLNSTHPLPRGGTDCDPLRLALQERLFRLLPENVMRCQIVTFKSGLGRIDSEVGGFR